MKDIVIHWMRRDMRLHDNRTLLAALDSGLPVLVAFLFDQEILDRLDNAQDRRVTFIHREALKLKAELQEAGGDLLMDHGNPTTVWANWIKQLSENGLNVREVHVGRDYEPYAQERDRKLSNWFDQQGIAFKGTKDSVVFEKNEVTKDDGKPYTVFTPYSKKWRKALQPSDYARCTFRREAVAAVDWLESDELVQQQVPTLEEMGFENVWKEGALVPPTIVEDQLLKAYGDQRDFPSVARHISPFRAFAFRNRKHP